MSKIDEKQIVYINSTQRDSGTDSNFMFSINLTKGNQFDRICCLQAGIPKSYYSVQTNFNYFTLTEGVLSTTIIVPIGNYTRTSFASSLKTLLNTSSPNGYTYNVTFPNSLTTVDTGLYTYSVTGNGGVQPVISFDTTTFINDLMGFVKGSTNAFLADTLNSTIVVNLQPHSSILIHCDLVSNPTQIGVNTDVLQAVFANISSAPYSNMQWICPDIEAFSQIMSNNTTNQAHFYFTDEEGNPIDFNGVNTQLTICFWKKNKSLTMLTGFIKYLTAFTEFYRNFSFDTKSEKEY